LSLLHNRYITDLLEEIVGKDNIKLNEPMKNHTSFRVGGPADILIMPSNTERLVEVLKLCKEKKVPFFIMGNGTNLIVRDKGIRGVVIKTYENFNEYKVIDNVIEAYAGILLSRIADIALEKELSGLEFASGIPGTLGGAVFMNAGAYGGEMKDIVIQTEYIDSDNQVRVLSGSQHEFGYRSSCIQRESGIVLKSRIMLKKGSKSEIKAVMEDLNTRRTEKQPLELPSAGSVFRRPEGYYAGKLIQDCGLRGYRIGGAEVSCKHCGFIVNSDGATAEDIISLIKHIQKSVKAKFGVDMRTEVRIVGEE